jgi:hypothetical protein
VYSNASYKKTCGSSLQLKMTELEHATYITGESKFIYIFHGVELLVYIIET